MAVYISQQSSTICYVSVRFDVLTAANMMMLKHIFKVSVNTTSLFNYKKLKHLNKSQYIKLYYNSL
jgi:hypothetical protein